MTPAFFLSAGESVINSLISGMCFDVVYGRTWVEFTESESHFLLMDRIFFQSICTFVTDIFGLNSIFLFYILYASVLSLFPSFSYLLLIW